jgi:hypothetical protein
VQVLLAALECGLSTTALFPSDNAALAEEWRKVGRFTPLALTDDGTVTEEDGDFYRAVGITCEVTGPDDVDDIARMAGVEPLVVVDSSTWRIIPAENLVAKFGATDESRLFSVSETPRTRRRCSRRWKPAWTVWFYAPTTRLSRGSSRRT